MNILKIPNPILKTKCENVPHVSVELLLQIDEMIEIAKDNDLVGLAANQVGIIQNVFVMNMTIQKEGEEIQPDNWQAFINPVIKRDKTKGENWDWESCGSIDTFIYLVKRHNQIVVNYMSIEGESKSVELKGHLARIAQHESHHLQGVLISDVGRERKRKVVK